MPERRESHLCWSTLAAGTEWLDLGQAGWRETVCYGPAGFPTYARLSLLAPPPPARGALRDLQDEDGAELRILDTAVAVLTEWTATPDDAYFLLWDGMPWSDSTTRPSQPPLTGYARSYHILRGPLGALAAGGGDQLDGLAPAFIWPSDRAWCLACDVDADWAGIGGAPDAIDALVAASGLDVVAVDRSV